MNLLKKFISLIRVNKKNENTATFKVEVFGKEYSKTFNATPEQVNEALKIMQENAKYDIGEWVGNNEIESVRDDGYVIYKRNRVTTKERNQIGFYGLKWFSENGKYCVVWVCDEDEEYNVGLVDCIEKRILYKRKITRPHDCIVNDLGIVCCEDWGKRDGEINSIILIDSNGVEITRNRHKWPLYSNLSYDEDKAHFFYTTNNFKKHFLK